MKNPNRQIELEAQNEELKAAKQEAVEARDRYMELYHMKAMGVHAPGAAAQTQITLSDITALKHRLGLERLVSTASTRLTNVTAQEADTTIVEILGCLAHFTQTGRCYLFSVSADLAVADNTHEWCAPGVRPQIDSLRNLPTRALPWLLERLRGEAPLLLSSLDDVPAEAEAERRLMQEGSVKAALLTPIRHAGILAGFIGCDDVRAERTWGDEDIRLLRIIGELLFDTLVRLKSEQALRASEELNRQTLQALPAHIAVIDRDGRVEAVNDAWAEFACANSASDAASVQVGANYLEACRRAAAVDSADAAQALAGIEAVLAGASMQFSMEYACHSPEMQRWFLMTVTPLGGRGAGGAVISHFNITERKQAEEALRESEQRIQQALHVSHSFTFDWETATDTVLRSDSCSAILGLTGESACRDTGQNYFQRVHPDDRERFVQMVYALRPGSDSYTTEYRLSRTDNTVVRLEETGQAVFDGAGKLQRLVGVCTDITAHKQTEEQLFATTQRLQALLDAVPVGVSFSDDVTCQHISGNPAVRAQFEVSPADNLSASAPSADAPGRKIRFFIDGRPVADNALPLQRAVAENRMIAPFELDVLLPDGRRWTAEASGAPVRDARGAVIGGIAVTVDITARKQAEDVFRFLGQCGTRGGDTCFFQDLARYLAQALAVDYVCIDRLEQGRLTAQTLAVFNSGGFEDNLSYTLRDTPCGEAVGKNICVYPANVRGLFAKDKVLQKLQAESYLGATLWSAQGKPIGLIAAIGRQPLGDTRMAESILQLVAVRAAGELERLQAERDLMQLNAELEQRVQARMSELVATNRELEAFCYSVSHDLRAPLRSIDGFSQALLEDYGAQLDAAGHEFLNRIRSNCQRMARLIDDLLHLARLSLAQLRRQPVDLTALAQAVIGELRQAEPDRRVDVRIAPGLTATGDPVLLRTALANLLQNAWKFTGERPDAVIEMGTAVGSRQSAVGSRPNGAEQDTGPDAHSASCVQRPEPAPVFFVRDNGVGFDMQYADKLCTPFQRLHAMTEFPGSGIGLATVQRVLHRHGGRLWFEAAPGKGATFFFTLGDAGALSGAGVGG